MKTKTVMILGTIGVALALSPSLFLWNRTASIPVGLYLRTFGPIQVGSTVSFPAPPMAREYAIVRGGQGYAAQFIKPIAAGPGDEICVFETMTGKWLIVDNKVVLSIHPTDNLGNPLPNFMMDDCRKLSHDEWLPIGMHRDSFDGRYFGPVKSEDIEGSYEPLMVFE
jgi:conjugative transfer signal peptidase TraF